MSEFPKTYEPQIFKDLKFEVWDELVTRIVNQDNLSGWGVLHYCEDCRDEALSIGQVLRNCNDMCCTVFFWLRDGKGEWVEVT